MSEDLIVLKLAQQQYALSVRHVREVLPRATLTALPGAPDGVLGVLSLRGTLLPVLDLRRRLGMPAMQARVSQCIVVADLERSTVGLLVDTVVGLVSGSQMEAPTSERVSGEILRQIVEINGHVVSVLDPDETVGSEIATYIASVTPQREALPSGSMGGTQSSQR